MRNKVLYVLAYCVCRVRGDPLVYLYDGNSMFLEGNKKYLMTKLQDETECAFVVDVQAGLLSDLQTYPRSVEVTILDMVVRLEQGGRVTVSTSHPNTTLNKHCKFSHYDLSFLLLDYH